MRLINTSTLEIHEFVDADAAPPYAILSHCWREDEVSFKEFSKQRKCSGAGYRKIVDYCAFGRSRQQDWVWIDTCCIDKRSSAELSEAINSMWDDVTASPEDKKEVLHQLTRSRWFTRGWTLQELLAPHFVLFVSADWSAIGLKCRPESKGYPMESPIPSLETWWTKPISNVTGIPLDVLQNDDDKGLNEVSAAERLSWIAGRESTRKEDIAYCLLGLFSINMPLLYGEGNRAFQRLLTEILTHTGDDSVFTWMAKWPESEPHASETSMFTGMLTQDHRRFATGGRIFNVFTIHDRPACSINGGLIEMRIGKSKRCGAYRTSGYGDTYVLRLNCIKVSQSLLERPHGHRPWRIEEGTHFARVICLKQRFCGHFVRIEHPPDQDEDEGSTLYQKEWTPVHGPETLYVHAFEGECNTISHFNGEKTWWLKFRFNGDQLQQLSSYNGYATRMVSRG